MAKQQKLKPLYNRSLDLFGFFLLKNDPDADWFSLFLHTRGWYAPKYWHGMYLWLFLHAVLPYMTDSLPSAVGVFVSSALWNQYIPWFLGGMMFLCFLDQTVGDIVAYITYNGSYNNGFIGRYHKLFGRYNENLYTHVKTRIPVKTCYLEMIKRDSEIRMHVKYPALQWNVELLGEMLLKHSFSKDIKENSAIYSKMIALVEDAYGVTFDGKRYRANPDWEKVRKLKEKFTCLY